MLFKLAKWFSLFPHWLSHDFFAAASRGVTHTHTVLPNKGSPFLEVSMLAAAFWQIIRQTKMTKMCSVMTCKICRLVISPFGFDGEEAYSIVWLSFKIGRTWPCLIRDPFHAITEDEKKPAADVHYFFSSFSNIGPMADLMSASSTYLDKNSCYNGQVYSQNYSSHCYYGNMEYLSSGVPHSSLNVPTVST